MRRILPAAGVLACVLVVGGCGSTATEETTTTAPTTTSAPTTTTTTTTTAPTTTTTAPTTTTTAAPTPEQLRGEFLAELDGRGWVTYVDEVIGWSIRYPAEWTVLEASPGERLTLLSGEAGSDSLGLFTVGALLDAPQGDLGSADYLRGNIEYSVDDGLLRAPGEDAWFWLDSDFDGEEGPLDIHGVEASFAIDPTTGSTLPADALAPTWWFGYYNPDLRPNYGYILQTIGYDPAMLALVDDVVLSFEPPAE